MSKFNRFNSVKILIFICLLVTVLISCQNRVSNRGSSLKPVECRLPCWREIEPGKTTEEEFLQLAESSPQIPTDLTKFEGSDIVTYDWNDIEANSFVTVYIENKTVAFIRIIPVPEIALKDVFSVFGSPDVYVASIAGGGGSGSLYFGMYYERSGIILEKFILPYVPTEEELASCSFVIEEDFAIEELYFVSPNRAEEMANSVEQPIFTEAKKWSGLGQILFTECDYTKSR